MNDLIIDKSYHNMKIEVVIKSFITRYVINLWMNQHGTWIRIRYKILRCLTTSLRDDQCKVKDHVNKCCT